MTNTDSLHQPNDGGPAFARPGFTAEQTESQEGMSLRDYFAAQTIGPLMASDGFEKRMMEDRNWPIEQLPRFAAQIAYQVADAMIIEREKRKPTAADNPVSEAKRMWENGEGCSCHIAPPCSFCVAMTEAEGDAYANGGIIALEKFWRESEQ